MNAPTTKSLLQSAMPDWEWNTVEDTYTAILADKHKYIRATGIKKLNDSWQLLISPDIIYAPDGNIQSFEIFSAVVNEFEEEVWYFSKYVDAQEDKRGISFHLDKCAERITEVYENKYKIMREEFENGFTSGSITIYNIKVLGAVSVDPAGLVINDISPGKDPWFHCESEIESSEMGEPILVPMSFITNGDKWIQLEFIEEIKEDKNPMKYVSKVCRSNIELTTTDAEMIKNNVMKFIENGDQGILL